MGISELLLFMFALDISWFVSRLIGRPKKVSINSYYKGDWASAIEDASYWAGHKNSSSKEIYFPPGDYEIKRSINLHPFEIKIDGNNSTLDCSNLKDGESCIYVPFHNGNCSNISISNLRFYRLKNQEK